MQEKILCVDDEQSILDGFQRQLRKQFTLVTRTSGEEGLKAIADEGSFAVVVSDMNMPGMDGIRFLAKVRDAVPDSVRIMLTGKADLQVAVDAVNEGNIFRFLTKPCASDVLVKALEAGCQQYRLITAERELLEKTLKGSIKVLVDVLALTNPAAFSRTERIKHLMLQVVTTMKLPNAWSYEVAAMLSQLGCVTIPSDIMEHMLGGAPLSETESRMISEHPAVGRNLIVNIPRLEGVAEMIARQTWRYVDLQALPNHQADPACVGAAILKAVMDYETMVFSGVPSDRALESMRNDRDMYDARILTLLKFTVLPTFKHEVKALKIQELKAGMVLSEDVRGKNGILILAKGQEVSDTLRRRLENCLLQGTVDNMIRVLMK